MDKAILRTLVYADIFHYPLKQLEIWKGLIYRVPPRNLSWKKFDEALKTLVKKKLIGSRQDYYFLPGKDRLVEIRIQRKIYSGLKLIRARRISNCLSSIPWVRFIGISGSLAKENAATDDDIDLFFIISQNRLWVSRGIVVLILLILGAYRRSTKIKDMICPNMFISEANLTIYPRNLYVASEICAIRPLVNKGMVYEEFLNKNKWVKNTLPNFEISRPKTTDGPLNQGYQFFNILDDLAMKMQLFYMGRRLTKEVVGKNLIKFHPNNVAGEIMKQYRHKVREIQ